MTDSPSRALAWPASTGWDNSGFGASGDYGGYVDTPNTDKHGQVIPAWSRQFALTEPSRRPQIWSLMDLMCMRLCGHFAVDEIPRTRRRQA